MFNFIGCSAVVLDGPRFSDGAAGLVVFCPRAVETAVEHIGHDFHAHSGVRLTLVPGTAGALAERAAAGESADVVISATPRVEELEQRGALVKGTRAELGRVGVGVAVRKGAPRPDIATPEALRRTLLDAGSLGYADPARGGTGGAHFARVIERLGIADVLRTKTRLYPQGVQALEAVARGELALAVTPTSEIVARDGLVLVGPLPGDLQSWLSYSAAVLATSASPETAEAFVALMTGAEGRRHFAAAGFEPPGALE